MQKHNEMNNKIEILLEIPISPPISDKESATWLVALFQNIDNVRIHFVICRIQYLGLSTTIPLYQHQDHPSDYQH